MSIGYPIGLYRGLLLLTMYIGWRPVSLYGSTVIMNELYTQTEVIRGRTYRYDPDYDCYYRIFSPEEYASLSHSERYGWLYVCIGALVITAIGMYVQA